MGASFLSVLPFPEDSRLLGWDTNGCAEEDTPELRRDKGFVYSPFLLLLSTFLPPGGVPFNFGCTLKSNWKHFKKY